MIRVLLVFNWSSVDDLQNPFFKVVALPALPPVGSTLWFDSPDGFLLDDVGPFTVRTVHWVEERSLWYEVHLLHKFDKPATEIIEAFTSAGWTHRDWPAAYGD